MNIITAVNDNWRLLFTQITDDSSFFNKETIGKIIVMGHCTFNTLLKSKPLKDRVNIVLSKDLDLFIEGAFVCNSIAELSRIVSTYRDDEVYVIGGQTIYKQLLKYCKFAFVIKHSFAETEMNGLFPDLDSSPNWHKKDQSEITHSEEKALLVRYENSLVGLFEQRAGYTFASLDVFTPKDQASLFIPKKIKKNYEFDCFCTELLDVAAAYTSPIEYGIGREEIGDFFENFESKGMGFFAFLRYKRFIATEGDIIELFLKYADASGVLCEGYEIKVQRKDLPELRDSLFNSSFDMFLRSFSAKSIHYDRLQKKFIE